MYGKNHYSIVISLQLIKINEKKKGSDINKIQSVGKECACSARDPGLIPGLERSPGEGNSPGVANHSSILAWKIPWTEEPGGLQSMGPQESGIT